MKLTRKQELQLIDLGLSKLLETLENTTTKPRRKAWNKGKSGRRWSANQRKKFVASMKKKWAEKKAAEK